jgi:glucans biosynthesis protein
MLSSTALSGFALAQEAVGAAPAPFDFDLFTARMKDLAAQDYEAPQFELPDSFNGLDYDDYRRIQFRPDHALWATEGPGFQVHAFHPGWLFKEPVKLFEITDGVASPISFGAADFDYHDADLQERVAGTTFPGVAGIRINYPLNAPERMDELVTFLGASYFRALGRDNVYGLSARGLLMNSWLDVPEVRLATKPSRQR